jgi:purine-binding chemotaxis protein CheW
MRRERAVDSGGPSERATDTADDLTYLTFFLGAEEYALPLSRVSEILPLGELTRVPAAPPFVIGLASLHGAAVPVIDVAAKFGAGTAAAERTRSIIAVRIAIAGSWYVVGMVIDHLGRVRRLSPGAVQPPPPLDGLISVEFLVGVFEGGGRFVMCVDVDRILGVDEASQLAAMAGESPEAEDESTAPKLSFLAVRMAGEPCVLGLGQLRQVQVCDRVSPIPGTPSFVLGATNVRGAIVPVVDVARRVGLQARDRRPTDCLVLVGLDADGREGTVGLVVDSIDGLLHATADEINRTPPFGTRFPASMVQGMAPSGGTFIPILDVLRALSPEAARATPGNPSELSRSSATSGRKGEIASAGAPR